MRGHGDAPGPSVASEASGIGRWKSSIPMDQAFDLGTPGFRVTRTFAFVDLCGFTDFVDEHGDEVGVAELRLLRAVVREVAPLCGVRVDKWLGDGVRLVGVGDGRVVGGVLA